MIRSIEARTSPSGVKPVVAPKTLIGMAWRIGANPECISQAIDRATARSNGSSGQSEAEG
jgi:hypothetical protein